jgi:hypothetical protein
VRKAAARRLALWVNGNYLLATDNSGFEDDLLDDDGADAVMTAKEDIARDMIERSGIPSDATQADAVRIADELTRRRR